MDRGGVDVSVGGGQGWGRCKCGGGQGRGRCKCRGYGTGAR